jgi:hypothetical protein
MASMATEGQALTATSGPSSEVRPSSRAAGIALAAFGIGLIIQLLFYGVGLGVNLPLAVAVLLSAGWIARPGERARPPLTDAWLPLAALLLATFVALRGDVTVVALDAIGAIGLTGAALASFAGLRVVERPLADLAALGIEVAGSALARAAEVLMAALRWLPIGWFRESSGRATPVLRGLVIAIPLLVIFGVLFASADAVFGRLAGDLFRWNVDLGSLPGRGLLAALAAWVAAGLLAFVGSPRDAGVSADSVAAWQRRPRLGTTEALTVLVVLDLLSAIFVALQAAYLFGGRDTLEAGGLTYADYARRGFFELMTVAFAVGALILGMEAFVARRGRTYLAAAIGLVLLTLVILASAFLRLRLYQDAYGWTELRFYVLSAILWLALGSLGAVVALATGRTRWLLHGMLVVSIAFGLGFNAIGPVRYIAERNVERAIHPELVAAGGETGLDVSYLASLGDDAVAVLKVALPDLPPNVRQDAEAALASRADQLALDNGQRSWQAWNLSRERARSIDTSYSLLSR